ncbi:hypothetical protein JHK85_026613 [Glycine max]|nr:hypothetical protein JHK85_026613 [Glycine max]
MVCVFSRYLPSLEELGKLLKLCADVKWLPFGKAMHAQFLIRNQTSNHSHISHLNSLVHLYVKCGQLGLARNLFDAMPLRNVVSWNVLMAGYLHGGNHLEVLVLFKNMVSLQNACPNEYVFTTALSACSHGGRVKEGMQCHGLLFKFGLVCHQYVKSALVHMYSRCSHVELALQVLDTVPGEHVNDIFSYNSVLNALVESGRGEEAVEVLRRMVDECVAWDHVTYVGVMGLCAQIRDLQLGLRVHARLLRGGLMFDEFVGSMLIDMYGKCGEVLNARNVFDGLQNRNVVVWTALMTAYLQNGYFEESLNLFTCMDREGIAALRHGDLLHARVEKLGFKNHVIVKWDVVAWRTLLNACHVHRNYDLGRRIAESVLQMDPHDVGTYTLLSNMYAKARRWDGVVTIRKLMRERNIKKEPGATRVECVWVFTFQPTEQVEHEFE